MHMQDRIGQQLGNYRLTQLLGKGGFARVYLGEHIYLQTPAAIKVLNEHDLTSDDQRGFTEEARTIRKLNHPHIVRLLEFGIETSKIDDSSTPFLVMEYLPDGTLRQRHPHNTTVPVDQIVSYVDQVADALQYAHDQKVVHRDVKPENMLVAGSNDIQLSDFGIAVTGHDSKKPPLIKNGIVQGTVFYIAPERFMGETHRACDQYSLGVVVYEWLAGVRPFEGTQERVIYLHINAAPPPLYGKYPHVSKEIEAVVFRALAKDPAQRYPSVKAFADALRDAAATAPTMRQAPSPVPIQPPVNTPHQTPPPSPVQPVQQPQQQQPAAPHAPATPSPVQANPSVASPPAVAGKQQATPPVTPQPAQQSSQQRQQQSAHQSTPTPQQIYLRSHTGRQQNSQYYSAATQNVNPPGPTGSSAQKPEGPFDDFIAMWRTITWPLNKLLNLVELDGEFTRLPRNRGFRSVGMILNVLSAFLLGFSQYPPSGWIIFFGLLWSLGFFNLCIRAVSPTLSIIFGMLIALYWCDVGIAVGEGIHLWIPQATTLFPPILLGIIFMIASGYLHYRYVKTRLE